MDKYILFFDIDGTIVDSFNGHKLISRRLRDAFKQLQDNGHLCFLATGRPLAYLNDDILSVGFDGYVLCNGAVVIKDDKVIRESIFPKDVLIDLVHTLDKNGNDYFLNYIKEVYFSKNNSEENELFGNEMIKNGIVYRDYVVEDLVITKIEINKLEENTIKYLKNMEKEGYVVVWYPKLNYAEITMPNVTKGHIIKEVLEMLDIPIERSIAFGDGDNDIEMLKTVGHGVAMGNGSDHVKAIADRITDTCHNEGIVKELLRLGLITG